MTFNKKYLLIIIFVLSVSYSFAQTRTIVSPPTPPGNIKLLPGYIHETKRGIDSRVGEINKKGGLTIRYDIGDMAGNYAESFYAREKQNVIWIKNQKINNQDTIIVLLKDGSIYATFTTLSANFMSNVKTNEDLTDFLLMIMTYGTPDKLNDKKSN